MSQPPDHFVIFYRTLSKAPAERDTALQARCHQSRAEQSGIITFFNQLVTLLLYQDIVCFLGCECTLLDHGHFAIPHAQVLLHRALNKLISQSIDIEDCPDPGAESCAWTCSPGGSNGSTTQSHLDPFGCHPFLLMNQLYHTVWCHLHIQKYSTVDLQIEDSNHS